MKHTKTLTLCSSFAAIVAFVGTAQAGVTLSIDSVTTQASTSWGGSPAGSLAQSIDTPNLQNSFDGGVSSGIIFKAGSSFTLGAVEIDANGYTGGAGNFNLFMYDLGSSFSTLGSPLYTFTGSEVNLFSAGLNTTLANASQFDVFSFSGADNISMNSGDSYLFLLVASDGISNLGWHRGPITANQAIAVNSVVVGGAGTVLNNSAAGANRTPIAAFFAVPEPASMTLLGLGALVGTFAIRRRK